MDPSSLRQAASRRRRESAQVSRLRTSSFSICGICVLTSIAFFRRARMEARVMGQEKRDALKYVLHPVAIHARRSLSLTIIPLTDDGSSRFDASKRSSALKKWKRSSVGKPGPDTTNSRSLRHRRRDLSHARARAGGRETTLCI